MTDPPALSALTTMRVGGTPERLLEPADRDALVATAREVWSTGDEWLLLGGGSNTIAADDGFEGTVLRIVTRGVERLAAEKGRIRLRVQAGEPWDALVALTVRNGWAGIEALSGIPGSTGAAPVQNIGAYGQEIESALIGVEFLDYLTGEVYTLARAELGLGYRTSALKRGMAGVVLSVDLELADHSVPGGVGASLSAPIAYAQLADALAVPLGSRVSVDELRRAVLALRASKGMVLDPADPDSVSAGSFFTNPIVSENVARALPSDAPRWSLGPPEPDTILSLGPEGVHPLDVPPFAAGPYEAKLSAAWLIENAGIRSGFALPGSGAAISSKHTLAIVNRGAATAADVAQLASFVRGRVQADFGVVLHPEPVLVGLTL
ncbi:UDP-N-acetylenolpyruvoylglucosamine reductase [Leifsonia xyli subsp. xyli]|uniref:UDP-N-acetylenolpyruvoylglucosamine reductase n=2 Tax=Leifsonia xyli subsp. xyli TaxID=59736 RepID=MURB_LEIXX|nr:UDP-N-acetylmuramate dehydrogenase [Leifsonia xyli]Q6AH30.1 RecName: Full=UDP-N-acetylenolpyruvoylglucosamine reductase; AltName: Full=UDP-N-acetylmuramate dehydrogenase [Leifsonia xyli subsp. xyli str. CTCB07]AAT88315.1 UDP-N-acetylmuramate dehydrogenase [Leifsonia xyli subsp. xyli str. CTCB07]ODA89756.1 UDP-N-acetylenolpyruvoylglucosamine reductase [Leifsonia xyli subsp. xyli]